MMGFLPSTLVASDCKGDNSLSIIRTLPDKVQNCLHDFPGTHLFSSFQPSQWIACAERLGLVVEIQRPSKAPHHARQVAG
jgi:hypothetical protein